MSTEKNEHHNPEDSRKSPEIRYVPLDMRAIENEGDEIDLVEIFKTFWEGRKTIYKTVAVFAVVGLFVALVSVEEYTSEVKVIPESQERMSLGALGGLAQQFGFSAAPQRSGETIPANLYPAIIESNVFLKELMAVEVPLPDNTEQVPLEEYFKEHQKGSLIKYTIRLPFTLIKWLMRSSDDEPTSVDQALAGRQELERLIRMPRADWGVLRSIRGRINAEQDVETGSVTVSVDMQDPVIAAVVADEVVQMLSEYIIEKRTEKARRDVEFIEERFEEAKDRFEKAQQELAEFNDQNRGQLTAMARTEEQLLQSRYDLNFNLYNSLAERLEEARIKLQEETPVINILEPAAVPDKRSEPYRTLILVVFIIFGGLAGTGIVLLRPSYTTLMNEIRDQ